MDFGESKEENCVRRCLIVEDMTECAYLPEPKRGICRGKAHVKCYWDCGFAPSPFDIPSSCWPVMLGR